MSAAGFRSLAVLLCLVGCDRPKRSSTAPADAGRRVVRVKLGAPVTEVQGDVWPRGQHTLSQHELKGPLELTVVLPSGRSFMVNVPSAIGATDDHHWPKPGEPPEVAPPNVGLVSFSFGRYPNFLAALDAANRQLAIIGVAPENIESWDRRLREREAPHPSYPLEGCAYAGANLLKAGGEYVLSIDVGLSCRRDGGR